MTISLDHVFICTAVNAPEAEALLAFGLIEGSSNVHPGQGTANRRFFFEGGFIELLWVANPLEAQSELTAPTRLWDRCSGSATHQNTRQTDQNIQNSQICPFGIGFSAIGEAAAPPPFESWAYHPRYLPADKSILFAKGTPLSEPELFYLSWPNPQTSSAIQPKQHKAPLQRMLSVSVGMPWVPNLSEAAQKAVSAGLLKFHTSAAYELVIDFQASEAVTLDLRQSLGLVLRGLMQ
jgi:Glyoxalase-like domain